MSARSTDAADPACEAVARLFSARTGFALRPGFGVDLEAGIHRAMVKTGIADVNDFLQRVQTDRSAFDELVTELVVSETYFFRDRTQFEFIRRDVLPEIQRRRGPDHSVRAWSAGCASGEEAYSLAIVFEQQGCSQAQVLATDVSRAALAKAQRALYGPWSLRGTDSVCIHSYFNETERGWLLIDRIRRRVTFEYLNLALDAFPSLTTRTRDMDLILCRNVLIYFSPETVRHVAQQLSLCLSKGGWLFTGPCDPLLGPEISLDRVITPAGVAYRHPHTDRAAAGAVRDGGSPVTQSRAQSFQSVKTPDESATVAPSQVQGPEPGGVNALELARQALARGEYSRAIELTVAMPHDARACALRVRAAANLLGSRQAQLACEGALRNHPLVPELYLLHALLLMDLDRNEEAARAVRKVLYLDGSLAIAHFVLGTILQRRGDRRGARRAYCNVCELCASTPVDEPVALGEGQCAGALAAAAQVQLGILDADSNEAR